MLAPLQWAWPYISPYVQSPPPALGVFPQTLVDDSEELHQPAVLAQVILKETHTTTQGHPLVVQQAMAPSNTMVLLATCVDPLATMVILAKCVDPQQQVPSS